MTDDYTWPPTAEQLAWRPTEAPPDLMIETDRLAGEGHELPEGVVAEGDDVAVHELAAVEFDAGHPGGGGLSQVFAVPRAGGGLAIVVTQDDGMPAVTVEARVDALPTLGELLAILDEEEDLAVGHGARVMNDLGDSRSALRGFVRMRSELYPMLEALDRSREEQWIAERP